MNDEFSNSLPTVIDPFNCPKDPPSTCAIAVLFKLFLVTILMAPVKAFCPKTRAAGPFIISIRSITSIGTAAFKV